MLKKRTDFDDRYERCRQDIRSQITGMTLQPGDFLLSEITLSKLYNMSRDSVRKVLAELENEGLIEKIPGKGNRIREPEYWKEQTALKLVCFGDSYEKPILERLITVFERDNPDIRITLSLVSENGYAEYLSEKLRDGDAHDLMVISDLHYRYFADAGLLDELLPSERSEWSDGDELYPEAMRLFEEGELLRAIPFVFSPVVYVVNKKLVPNAAEWQVRNWDELLAFARRHTIREDGQTVRQYGFGFTITNNRWPQFLLQNGGGVYDREGRSLFSSPETVEAFGYCLDLMFQQEVSPASIYGGTRIVEDLFMADKVAMIIGTYHFMNEFGAHFRDWDVVPVVPGNKRPATLLIGGALAVSARSPNAAAAKRFIRFVTGTYAQEQLKRHGCTIPVRRRVAEDRTLFNPALHPEHYHAFVDMLPYSYAIRDLGIGQGLLDEMQKRLVLMWMKMEQPEEAVKRIEKELLPGSAQVRKKE
ncbi:hypothetical protein J31TS4_16640 [Paenibacillus sp. J31TS4]|uniref:extracellular solute-binding protein n=1 Tax=Paenibacillus sp. J31TS4 TaxID=2807195 RepID=UPI001B09A01B|nr:extracellular solute-binding protein [Paenibacillus sp. J31TS4]GIP38384.1 hypothetical protein J31TS4_16640 [Paenibacillus sp. J31TS4]